MGKVFLDATTVLSILAVHLQHGREDDAANTGVAAPLRTAELHHPGQTIDILDRGEMARRVEVRR